MAKDNGNKAVTEVGMVCGDCGSNNVYHVEPYAMNVKQAAIFLNCSEYMVRELCRKEKIPHSRYSNTDQGKIYFTRKALVEWIEKKERRSWK